MSGGEPSSIKRICLCAASQPFLSWLHGKRAWFQIQMWVCDLVMGRSRKRRGYPLRSACRKPLFGTLMDC